MLYDTGDVVRFRSGHCTPYEETLLYIVRNVNVLTCRVIIECINSPVPVTETVNFNDIELLEM